MSLWWKIILGICSVVVILTAGAFLYFRHNADPSKEQDEVVRQIEVGAEEETVLPQELEEPEIFTFAIGGDMMFDRAIDNNFRGDKIFDVVAKLKESLVFANKDLSFVNLEGPISATPIPADSTANNMSFNFPPKTLDALLDLEIDAVSLANNHTRNNGAAGFANTIKVLTEKGIVPIGDQSSFEQETSIKRFTKGDITLSVFAIHCLQVSTDITALIKTEKASGNYVLIFPHWGEEYNLTHVSSQTRLAHSWIDAGADMVIGSHPHVIEDAELYKGRPIFYSIGNLLFDQTFSKATMRGLIISGSISSEKDLTIDLIPVVSQKLIPTLTETPEKDGITSSFYKIFNQDATMPLKFQL